MSYSHHVPEPLTQHLPIMKRIEKKKVAAGGVVTEIRNNTIYTAMGKKALFAPFFSTPSFAFEGRSTNLFFFFTVATPFFRYFKLKGVTKLELCQLFLFISSFHALPRFQSHALPISFLFFFVVVLSPFHMHHYTLIAQSLPLPLQDSHLPSCSCFLPSLLNKCQEEEKAKTQQKKKNRDTQTLSLLRALWLFTERLCSISTN